MSEPEAYAAALPRVAGDSLKKRYVYKLLTNFLALFIGLGTQAIVPRGLGPVAYGNFNFLTNFFQQLLGFLDMGTSVCFYTKLSQRQKDFGLISFYGYFSGGIALVVLAFVGLTQALSIHPKLWPDQQIGFVYLAAFFGIATWFSGTVVSRMADAYGITVSAEMANMAQKVIGLFLILFLYFSGLLNLTTYFLYHYVIIGSLAACLLVLIHQKGHAILQKAWLSGREIKEYAREFYGYSHPLFLFSVVVFVVGILDRWLLQYFNGSVQQGFYGLSYLIGSACSVFTGAMIPLIWRELSIAFEKKDFDHMSHLFSRYVPFLYTIAAALSCFIAVQADKVLQIMGGHQYSGALWTLTIMAFYPIHQTYGQLNSVVCMAAGQTRLYSNIGMLIMLIGVPVGYFLVAPANFMGLNAGAAGLAVKMIVMQILGVNLQLYYNCRFLKLKFSRYVMHQLFSVLLLLVFSELVLLAVDRISFLQGQVIVSLFVSGVLYASAIMGLFYLKPGIFGLDRNDISLMSQFIVQRIRK